MIQTIVNFFAGPDIPKSLAKPIHNPSFTGKPVESTDPMPTRVPPKNPLLKIAYHARNFATWIVASVTPDKIRAQQQFSADIDEIDTRYQDVLRALSPETRDDCINSQDIRDLLKGLEGSLSKAEVSAKQAGATKQSDGQQYDRSDIAAKRIVRFLQQHMTDDQLYKLHCGIQQVHEQASYNRDAQDVIKNKEFQQLEKALQNNSAQSRLIFRDFIQALSPGELSKIDISHATVLLTKVDHLLKTTREIDNRQTHSTVFAVNDHLSNSMYYSDFEKLRRGLEQAKHTPLTKDRHFLALQSLLINNEKYQQAIEHDKKTDEMLTNAVADTIKQFAPDSMANGGPKLAKTSTNVQHPPVGEPPAMGNVPVTSPARPITVKT